MVVFLRFSRGLPACYIASRLIREKSVLTSPLRADLSWNVLLLVPQLLGFRVRC